MERDAVKGDGPTSLLLACVPQRHLVFHEEILVCVVACQSTAQRAEGWWDGVRIALIGIAHGGLI